MGCIFPFACSVLVSCKEGHPAWRFLVRAMPVPCRCYVSSAIPVYVSCLKVTRSVHDVRDCLFVHSVGNDAELFENFWDWLMFYFSWKNDVASNECHDASIPLISVLGFLCRLFLFAGFFVKNVNPSTPRVHSKSTLPLNHYARRKHLLWLRLRSYLVHCNVK